MTLKLKREENTFLQIVERDHLLKKNTEKPPDDPRAFSSFCSPVAIFMGHLHKKCDFQSILHFDEKSHTQWEHLLYVLALFRFFAVPQRRSDFHGGNRARCIAVVLVENEVFAAVVSVHVVTHLQNTMIQKSWAEKSCPSHRGYILENWGFRGRSMCTRGSTRAKYIKWVEQSCLLHCGWVCAMWGVYMCGIRTTSDAPAKQDNIYIWCRKVDIYIWYRKVDVYIYDTEKLTYIWYRKVVVLFYFEDGLSYIGASNYTYMYTYMYIYLYVHIWYRMFKFAYRTYMIHTFSDTWVATVSTID